MSRTLLAYECSICGKLYVTSFVKCPNCGSEEEWNEFRADAAQHAEAVLGSLDEAAKNGAYPAFARLWAEHAVGMGDSPRFETLLRTAKVGALTAIRELMRSGDSVRAAAYYLDCIGLLASLDAFAENEREWLTSALRVFEATGSTALRRAIFLEDDEQISAAYRAYKAAPRWNDLLTIPEQNRVALADQRLEALHRLRGALRSGDAYAALKIYAEYEELLLGCRNFTAEERKQVDWMRQNDLVDRLRQAITVGDVNQIADFARRAVIYGYQLSSWEREAANVARELAVRLKVLRKAIDSDDDIGIALTAHGDWLNACPGISETDRQRISLAGIAIQRGAHVRDSF